MEILSNDIIRRFLIEIDSYFEYKTATCKSYLTEYDSYVYMGGNEELKAKLSCLYYFGDMFLTNKMSLNNEPRLIAIAQGLDAIFDKSAAQEQCKKHLEKDKLPHYSAKELNDQYILKYESQLKYKDVILNRCIACNKADLTDVDINIISEKFNIYSGKKLKEFLDKYVDTFDSYFYDKTVNNENIIYLYRMCGKCSSKMKEGDIEQYLTEGCIVEKTELVETNNISNDLL